MAFTVETGAIVAGANSYLSVADADAYHADRGNSSWTGATAAKQAALVRATDYLTQKYTGRWKGYVVSDDQPLDFPRLGLVFDDSDEIPVNIKQAVAVLALEALSTDLNPVMDRAIKREKVDVIEVEYEDFSRKTRPAVEGLLRPYLKGSSINAPLIRG